MIGMGIGISTAAAPPNTELLVNQVIAVVATFAFSFVVTYAVARVLNATMGIRVSPEDELAGLDQSQHAEAAYQA
ncbi:MAG: ammonium transporter [Actinobacteria bacterium]|nr:ammonium transporter [Actinomycetota bacterium]